MSRNSSSSTLPALADVKLTPNSLKAAPPSTAHHIDAAIPTKRCHIVKSLDFEGYGFNLHSEKIKPGQYIGKVDANSPAEQAGLREGDRIIEVNGVPIGSETHKQVVQRIKAISFEVVLLLIDAEENSTTKNASRTTTNGQKPKTAAAESNNDNGNQEQKQRSRGSNSSNDISNAEDYHGTVQEIPGASANISSISMISTKRLSNTSNHSNNNSNNNISTNSDTNNGIDVLDRAESVAVTLTKITTATNAEPECAKSLAAAQNINNIPPPPSATTAAAAVAAVKLPQQHLANISSNTNSNGSGISPKNRVGSLQLPMTAAEMRAKLLSKKKFDPKNESVDLKKKFEIIQKL